MLCGVPSYVELSDGRQAGKASAGPALHITDDLLKEVIMGQIQNERAVWSPTSEHMYMLRRIERADAANQSTLRAFAAWLAETRGLQAGSITVRIGSAGSFVDAVTARTGETCAQAFQSLTAEGVEDFFVQYGKD